MENGKDTICDDANQTDAEYISYRDAIARGDFYIENPVFLRRLANAALNSVWKNAPEDADEAVVSFRKNGLEIDFPHVFTCKKRFTPKNGECVLVDVFGLAQYAIAYSDHEIYTWQNKTGEKRIVEAVMKPFDLSKVGMPWSEV